MAHALVATADATDAVDLLESKDAKVPMIAERQVTPTPSISEIASQFEEFLSSEELNADADGQILSSADSPSVGLLSSLLGSWKSN